MPLPVFLDLEGGTSKMDVARISGVTEWGHIKAALAQEDLWADVKTIVVDTVTRAEEMCVKHVVEHVLHPDKPTERRIKSIEDYGWGKGYVFLCEEFLTLLGALDKHVRQGRNVVLIGHDCIYSQRNPAGEDWDQYQPRLLSQKNASIRHRVKEWCNHLLFLAMDVFASDGKGIGETRSCYFHPAGSHWAKTRTIEDPSLPYDLGGEAILDLIFGGER